MKVLTGAARRLDFAFGTLRALPAAVGLARQKGHQLQIFDSLRERYSQHFRDIAEAEVPDFVTPAWRAYVREAEKVLVPDPPFFFLRERAIRDTMFVARGGRWLAEELRLLEAWRPPAELRGLLEEDYVGGPILMHRAYGTSHNAIHHLHHLAKFEIRSSADISRIASAIEWGGGYGSLAKLAKRMNPAVTYVIIDLPLFCCVQWIYLATVLGADSVNLIKARGESVRAGLINLLPLSLVVDTDLRTELFIATWSLSESTQVAQDFVARRSFFGATRFLLAFQKGSEVFPSAGRLEQLAVQRGLSLERIEFLPNDWYAIK